MSTRIIHWSVLGMLLLGAGLACPISAQEFSDDNREGREALQATVPVTLAELESLAIQQNPQLARASYIVAASQGRAEQAGLYPNPTVGVTFDELGDRTGPGGVNTLPLVTQEIVTAGKLQLSQAAALRQVNQETWKLMSRKFDMLADIRTKYYDALEVQTRILILQKMVSIAERSVEQADELLEAKQVARLDVVQLEIEVERLRTDLEAAERQLPGTYRNLAAAVGDPNLMIEAVDGELSDLIPIYDLNSVQSLVLSTHPDVNAARQGVERNRLLVQRARKEPIPNVTLDAGYVRQNQNRSNDFRIGASVIVPLWNRNQGNIRAAEAEHCEAIQQIRMAETELTDRLSLAIRDYAAAQRRADRYATSILPRAKETLDLSRKAYQGGEFEYLRILEAQRAFAQAYLDYVRALGDGWKAAATLSGLTLEESWPPLEASIPPLPESEEPAN